MPNSNNDQKSFSERLKEKIELEKVKDSETSLKEDNIDEDELIEQPIAVEDILEENEEAFVIEEEKVEPLLGDTVEFGGKTFSPEVESMDTKTQIISSPRDIERVEKDAKISKERIDKREKEKKNRIILISCISAASLLIVGAVVFMLLQRDTRESGLLDTSIFEITKVSDKDKDEDEDSTKSNEVRIAELKGQIEANNNSIAKLETSIEGYTQTITDENAKYKDYSDKNEKLAPYLGNLTTYAKELTDKETAYNNAESGSSEQDQILQDMIAIAKKINTISSDCQLTQKVDEAMPTSAQGNGVLQELSNLVTTNTNAQGQAKANVATAEQNKANAEQKIVNLKAENVTLNEELTELTKSKE